MLDGLRERIPVNLELAGNPVNWIIVLLMIAIAGLGMSLIFHQPGSNSQS